MLALRPFIPLLFAAGILLAGNGLFSTLIAVKGVQEGMSAAQIGWMGTTNFVGFLLGCIVVPRILRSVGHIRTFAALAALAASATLVMAMKADPYNWLVMRAVTGFCFSGLFTTIESWLNTGVRNEVRGKILAVYRIVDILVVSGAQFMLPIFGTEGFTLFGIMAMMICLSLVPVAIGDRSNPKPPEIFKFDIKAIWIISPLACAGCVAIGMTNSAFRFVGPLYGEAIGLDLTDIATFISLGVVGGAVLQYPLGTLSDKYDRRWILIFATLGAVAAGMFLSVVAGKNVLLVYVGIFAFGAFSLPLYSLSAAHANDRAEQGQYVLLAAGLMFFYGIGAIVGPPVSSIMLGAFGPESLFVFTSVIHGTLVVATLFRMRARDAVPDARRGRFTMLVRTSPFMQKLTRNRDKA
ncbi:MFS transporter [Pseudahrensia aquimaris]|uniref:MFS transporter n=1 Tax=Pseudahrensia aquimaris TaxID=744461 RepID=A0ABW3FD68_9HYPH